MAAFSASSPLAHSAATAPVNTSPVPMVASSGPPSVTDPGSAGTGNEGRVALEQHDDILGAGQVGGGNVGGVVTGHSTELPGMRGDERWGTAPQQAGVGDGVEPVGVDEQLAVPAADQLRHELLLIWTEPGSKRQHIEPGSLRQQLSHIRRVESIFCAYPPGHDPGAHAFQRRLPPAGDGGGHGSGTGPEGTRGGQHDGAGETGRASDNQHRAGRPLVGGAGPPGNEGVALLDQAQLRGTALESDVSDFDRATALRSLAEKMSNLESVEGHGAIAEEGLTGHPCRRRR